MVSEVGFAASDRVNGIREGRFLPAEGRQSAQFDSVFCGSRGNASFEFKFVYGHIDRTIADATGNTLRLTGEVLGGSFNGRVTISSPGQYILVGRARGRTDETGRLAINYSAANTEGYVGGYCAAILEFVRVNGE